MPKACFAILAAAVIWAALAQPCAAQNAPATPAPVATPKTLYRPTFDGKWHFTAIPYLWAPNVNGSFHFKVPSVRPKDQGRAVDIATTVGPSDYLSNLNFAIEFAGELRHDAFSTYIDFININANTDVGTIASITGPLGKVEIPISVNLNTHLSSTMWAIAPGYTLAHGSDGTLDVMAGYRSASLRSTIGWQLHGPLNLIHPSGSASIDKTFGDIIVGIRGNVFLSDRWYMPYYGDLGWGNNNSTWQAYGGLGYAGRTTDVVLVYRNVLYAATGGPLQIMRLGGPAVGVVLHW